MQAYAAAERPAPRERLHVLDSTPPTLARQAPPEAALLDHLLGRLADLVAERLMDRADDRTRRADDWMDARTAAAYLGVHPDTVRKLAAQRAIPVHQDGPRCKLYFRQGELDAWRGSTPASLRAV